MVDSVEVARDARRSVVLANTNSKTIVLAHQSTVVIRRSIRIERIHRGDVRERCSIGGDRLRINLGLLE